MDQSWEKTTQKQGFFERVTQYCKNPYNVSHAILGVVFTALSLWTLLYYITGPALAYFHSDCTDSLLWAQMMIESGSVLSEDFAYAAILPFGSPLWMVPILKICGYTYTAQVISMSVFAVIFVLSAISLFRALGWRFSLCGAASFCLSLLLSGSVKLREIMWEHVIYYSLGILFLMLTANLSIRLYRRVSAYGEGDHSKKNKAILAIFALLLFLLCAGIATDGFQMIAITAVPVIAALIALAVFDSKNALFSNVSKGKYLLICCMAVGMVTGLLALNVITKNGEISAGYENAYSQWSDLSVWMDNALKFPYQYLSLFGIEIEKNQPLFSLDSIFVMLRLAVALLLLISPILLLCRYKKIRSDAEKILLWSHLVVTAVIMLGFICGKLSGANWRLVPMLGSSILVTLIYVKELLWSEEVEKRIGTVFAALLICVSFLTAQTMLQMPHNAGNTFQNIATTLSNKGYTYGYATFWQSNNTTLLSNGRVKVVTVNINNGTVERRAYQTASYWFEDQEGQEDYFLLLTANEYQEVKRSKYWQDLNLNCDLIDEFTCDGYHILVFNGNVFTTFD